MSQEWRSRETDPLQRLVNEVNALRRELGAITNGILTNAGLAVGKGILRVLENFHINGDGVVGGDLSSANHEPDVAGWRLAGDGTAEFAGDTTVGGDLAVKNGGGISIEEDGRFEATPPADVSTAPTTVIGRVRDATDPTVTNGYGILVQRPGADVFSARTDADGDAHTVRVADNTDEAVVWVAESTPRGLTRPTWTTPMVSDYWQTWGSTESATFETVAQGFSDAWHDQLFVPCKATSSDSATTGEIQVTVWVPSASTRYVVDGVEPVGFGIGWHYFENPLPAAVPIGTTVYVELQARRTAGTGRIHAQSFGARWRPSS